MPSVIKEDNMEKNILLSNIPKVDDILNHKDINAHEEVIVKGNTVANSIKRVQTPNGRNVWTSCYKTPLKNDEGEITLVFNNVIKHSEDDFTTTLTFEKNAEMWNRMYFRYNPATQRPLIVREYAGGEYQEPYLNQKTKKEIINKILNNEQIPNVITANIPSDDPNLFYQYIQP
jgi:hypothetical protein